MVKVRRGYRSRNVEYRGRAAGGGGGMRLPMPQSRGGKVGAGAGGAGLIGIVIAVVIALISGGGGSFGEVGLSPSEGGPTAGGGGVVGEAPEQDSFYEAVFDDVQNTWIQIFEAGGQEYREAGLVIFEDVVDTDGCGRATEAVGPFYCPADELAYFDPDFFAELSGPRFGAPGDFAIAYVVAHEIAHHVQNITGVSAEVRQRQQGASQGEVNDLSIRLELQADCLAGVWAFDATRRPSTFEGNDNILYLERGDLREGLTAAQAVGDDRIQETAGAQVDPHKWNHGSAEQREAWLTLGIDTGDPGRCQDTFDLDIPGIEIMPG
jgi:predicted metalloprotease